MTFTEAAAQVLRLVGKPLHYKEITDVAIEKNLLSHVGKRPEVTMGARLAALVKKAEKDNPLVRVKPGVFALREWDQKTIDKGLADRTPAIELANRAGETTEEETPAEGAEEEEAPLASSPTHITGEEMGEDAPPPDEDEKVRAEIAAQATALFEAEEDDDEPILGAPEEEENDESDRDSDRDGGSRRRRRRRRRGGRDRDDSRDSRESRGGNSGGGDDLPSYTVSDAPALLDDFSGRDGGGGGGGGGGDDFAIDELAGRSLADALAQILAGYDKGTSLVGAQRLAETAQRRGRVAGDLNHVQSALLAAARADNLRRSGEGQRPRFRLQGNRIGLTDWLLDGELSRLEREITTLVERYRETARRSFAKRVSDLPHRAIGELVLLVLERIGVSELRPVRRAGAPGSELHLAGKMKGALGDIRTAIVVRRDGREIGRERVMELRGALHHYGSATAGLIVTTGQVLSGAREEAAAAGAAPVTLIDGTAFARLCEDHGIAVAPTRIALPLPDLELLDSLRNG